jgi:uncharacterized membrane protein YraQ (UPF0718 family)
MPIFAESYQSTVMIAVDVSFLAVPSVNIQNAGSVAVISTYISLFCIVGSLVVSLFLARQNRMYGQESADAAVSKEHCTGDQNIAETISGCIPHASNRLRIWH